MKPEEYFDANKSTIDEIHAPLFSQHDVRLFIKRDDLIHDEVSGNKWRKLKYNILKCIDNKNEGILTFGGAYSNHLVATASACHELGLNSIGIVRGDELNAESNDSLKKCASYGMQLLFVSRKEYSQRNEKYYQSELMSQFPNYWIVPEGGANYYGILGSQEILGEIDLEFDEVFVAQGTTTTSTGLALSNSISARINVVPVLKGFNSIEEMKALLVSSGYEPSFIDESIDEVNVLEQFHFGGYGKYDAELLGFIQTFYRMHGIKLDPIYTGKVMFGIFDLIKRGVLNGKTILFIHTGGVQGSAGVEKKMGIDLYP